MTPSYQATLPLTRFVLIAGAALTFLAGIQLFVLIGYTAEHFSWTIKSTSTAAVLGSFYWTASLLAFLTWRRSAWIWLILYLCYPILVTVALAIQLRASGPDPARTPR